jgi:ectoine hydroxylase-related dioxygenase (phytanoyl-CoA dioxygenase family)
MTEVDGEVLAAFRRDGAVVVRGAFTDWVEPLRAGIERNMADPGPDARHYTTDDGPGLFFGDYCNWQRIPEYRDFILHSPAGKIAARLMGSKTARIFHEHVLVKEPGAGQATPWHHDQPYYCVDGSQTCSLWLALDPVPRDTCVEYVAGSHTWGRWFRPERFNGQKINEMDGWEAVPDIDGHRDDYQILGWDLEPGDAIAFHFMTLHGAPPNRSASRRRRAFATRWIGDDARFADRQGPISPPFRDVTLTHGAVMDAPEFPIIYPSAV